MEQNSQDKETKMSAEYLEGLRAAAENKYSYENPYKKGTTEHSNWNRGYISHFNYND